MVIFLTKKYLANFNHSSFHLNNNSCTGRQLNHSHIILQTGLNDCGTVNRSYNGSYIFTNLVHGYLKNTDNRSSKNIVTTFVVKCNGSSEMEKSNRTSPQFNVTVSNVESKATPVKDALSQQPMQLELQADETIATSSQRKHSVTAITPENASLLSSASLKNEGTALKLQTGERPSAIVPKPWSRRKNRVSPCNSGSVRNPGFIETPALPGGSNRSSPASPSSESSGWSVRTLGTLSSNSSTEEYSDGSYQSVSDNEKTATPHPQIQPAITAGRLIIVQPCKSFSPSLDESSSTAEVLPCERSSKTLTITEAKADIVEVFFSKDESLDICSSTSSFGTWTDDPQDIELDELSEDESCKVFPYDF
ncbi:hypothetical protein ACROYT_G003742 [Oculina patagonica]